MQLIRRYSGFTLIELMMVLVVMAIILSVAVPSFRTMFANNQSISISEDLIVAVNLARSEAVKRGKLVSICRTTTGNTTTPACASATGDWNTGFIVYIDKSASETTSTTITTTLPTDDIIRIFPPLTSDKAAISVKRGTSDVTFLRYNPMGVLAKNSTNEATITTSVAKCKGDNKRVITVKLSGSISVAKQACS